MGTLAAHRWGDMRKDVEAVWKPMQAELFERQRQIEENALALFNKSPKRVPAFLTRYSTEWGDRVVQRCWELGDFLWTKYDEEF